MNWFPTARAYGAPNTLPRVVIALVGLVLVSACATAPGGSSSWGAPTGLYASRGAQPSGSSSGQKIGRPYQVNGTWYVPAREDDYNEVGVASWYGPQFHGKPTASGERFDQYALTAAHTTLPLPSLVEVRNLENGRTVRVRVNDRGPFVDDRIIDLSRGAARELGFERQGTARVRVRYLGPADGAVTAAATRPRGGVRQAARGVYAPGPARRDAPEPSRDGLFVQVASFRDPHRADALVRRLGADGGAAFVTVVDIDGRTWNRVMVGPWRNMRGARAARREVARMGFRDARIVDRR